MKITIEYFKIEVYKLVGNEYEVLSKEYKNNSTSLLIKHNKCGNIFNMSRKAFLAGQRCPKERYKRSAESNSKTQGKPEEKQKQIDKICNDEGYKCLIGYERSKKPLLIIHNKCGKEFKPTPYDFLKGTRCPYCYRSKGEEVVKKFLEDNNYIFKEQYRIKECRNKRPLPFDFALFDDKQELYALIEYDGSQHFDNKFSFNGDNENFIKTQINDNIKNDFCEKNKIPLIRIKYARTDRKDYEKIIKNRLKESLKYLI